ncbi:tetratricopeptide repeat protein [Streptomyces lanatus]|uniref:Tetratricopeptide repeat protein n=1 Tax=Streptomyces lanatus TaxID=66900 RepID=A0ABV1XVW7_9ACTN|nr:tetratricopeptide repeat protein [Streptomyces lanatus]
MTTSRIPADVPSEAFRPADRNDGERVDTPPPAADSLRTALLVSRARTAARSGDLDGAVRLLHDADDAHRDVLDLLARLHAQRGELARAAEYWRRVQEQHPRDPAAAAGLARIDRLGRRGPRSALARHRAGTALAAAVCAVAAITAGTVALTDARGDRPAPSQTDRAERLAERLDAERRAQQAQDRAREAERRAEAARALADALRAPGIAPVAQDGSVEVAFADGLFSEGAELTPVGAERLAVLGERLAGRTVRVEIYGQTATVPGAPTSGGSVLSLWRALIAARELSTAADKPLTAFTTASADQRDAPFAGVARNRTVTVVITPV